MFNERGIEYVGMRELAAELDIRVGNITYYFPTKDDLVFELSQELTRKNSQLIVNDKNMTMANFLQMLQRVFENHYEFRCLLRSFVHIMTQNKLVADSYKKIQGNRQNTIAATIQTLIANGYLKLEAGEQVNFFTSTLALITRYWISETYVFDRHSSKEEQIRHYLFMVTNLLLPYCSAKAEKQISLFRTKM
jgi:AcrR family transcriptional regulator